MSGIVGILNTDGAPVDRHLLVEMTESLRFRGPDAHRVRIDDHVGFGHALLAATEEASSELQPCTLDGAVWITADARVDAREDLLRALAARGRDANGANDAELLLHAYAAWGEDCPAHLLGDFAFAIWDAPKRRLFCARDQFGVKPFYYAHRDRAFVFSNTLECVRLHPSVSSALDELAIADYLLFYYNQTCDTTAFADVRRLPGAHTLTLTAGMTQPRVQRYWSLPDDPEVRYRAKGDYVEHGLEVITAAVADRLRTRRVSVTMSGGVDSTAMAAISHRLLSSDGRPFDLRAYTVVNDRSALTEERRHAKTVADAFDIPIEYFDGDAAVPYEEPPHMRLRTPEPVDEPYLALLWDLYQRAAASSRVMLTGSDGDTLFEELRSRHFRALARKGRFRQLAYSGAAYMQHYHAPPPVGFRTALQRLRNRTSSQLPEFPDWINADLVRKFDLRARWRERLDGSRLPRVTRPRATWVLNSPQWTYLFESRDPGVTGLPLEFRHPLVDLRVVELAMTLPVVPWCLDKKILRDAMRGYLPESVRVRKKTPVAEDPMAPWYARPEVVQRLDALPHVPVFSQFIAAETSLIAGQKTADSVYLRLRPRSLYDWLQYATGPKSVGVYDAEQRAGQVDAKQAAVPKPAGADVRQHP